MLDSLVRVSQQQLWKTQKKYFVCHSLGARDWWSGRGDTLRCDAGRNFWESSTRERSSMHRSKLDIRGADTRAGGMSISQVRRHRHAVECRFRHRLPANPVHGIAEIVVAADTQVTPTSRPLLVFAAEVRGGARRPFGR